MDFIMGDSIPAKFIKVGLVALIVYLICETVLYIYKQYKKYTTSKPWILKGTKSGRKRMILLQDPNSDGAVQLKRSENEMGGLEFSYAFWIHIDDWSYKFGKWKHILHKGNDTSWPLRAPGIWLHPKKNALRVYMNTFKNIAEYTDVDNIPLNKWFHVVVAVKQRGLDIFVNGNLAKRETLQGLPKQNYGDLYVNSFRGFGGYLSNMRYFDYYVSFSEIDSMLNAGPAESGCVDSNEMPPYFTQNWWVDR